VLLVYLRCVVRYEVDTKYLLEHWVDVGEDGAVQVAVFVGGRFVGGGFGGGRGLREYPLRDERGGATGVRISTVWIIESSSCISRTVSLVTMNSAA
jgi:hypothetical protein